MTEDLTEQHENVSVVFSTSNLAFVSFQENRKDLMQDPSVQQDFLATLNQLQGHEDIQCINHSTCYSLVHCNIKRYIPVTVSVINQTVNIKSNTEKYTHMSEQRHTVPNLSTK